MTRGSRGRIVRIDPGNVPAGGNDHIVRAPCPVRFTREGPLKQHIKALGGASLLVIMSAIAGQAQTLPPDPPKFEAQQLPNFVGVGDILEYRALPKYSEPAWVTKNYVETGKLPPVAERLPKEPMVFKTANMPDGVGVYGDTMRHVIGGRPQGWNFLAGNNQGWGGIDIGMYECLTRTGPLFTIKAEELQPMPNLAKSWEWSEDGHQLTMHLVEGAKWSDGVPFTSADVMFTWEDNIVDPNVTPAVGTTAETFGEGTKLEALDDYTIRWTFKEPFADAVPLSNGVRELLPQPGAHPQGPSPQVQSGRDLRDLQELPAAGLHELSRSSARGSSTGYRPDDIVILRRNPYYWKVDEAGNQLPYLDEVVYKLSTWADRDVQAVAGTGDFSNLEQPENYVESLKRAAAPDSPARLAFGARTIGYALLPEPLGQRLGRSRRARTGGARAQPQRSISATASPAPSTGSGSATRW